MSKLVRLIIFSSLLFSALIYISRKSKLNQFRLKETLDNKSYSYKIQINTAKQIEFENLPRVGPALAKRIIDYRNREGSFERLEDIKKVKGVGEDTFEQISPYLTVETNVFNLAQKN